MAGAVAIEAVGDGAMVVDVNMIAATPDPEFLAEISTDAVVWHVSWHTAPSRRMVHEVNGRALAAIRPELDTLAATRDAPWPTTEETALALIEDRTGVHLNVELSDRSHCAVKVDY
ncbi:hypothetical protein [Nonomuraea longicatena]|uniref:Uncharacterized protein n=1 Tax=Nonomuraea longicatena TaxID=83682 RepID=A0ABN1PMG5_9ACTN